MSTPSVYSRRLTVRQRLRPADIHRLYRYAEIGNICLAALKSGPLTTPELAYKMAEAKGFDTSDKTLMLTLTARAIYSTRSMQLREKVVEAARGNKSRRMILWRLP
jgi:hypothetical protein